MVSKEKNTIVIYHGDCNDGFAAALAAWKFFGDNAQYIAGEYGTDKKFPFDKINVDNKDVIILDFSYDRESMENLVSKASMVRLLDHHKTAKDELGDMACCTFNLEESGAVMAWKFFHPKKALPYFYELIQDRDLWTKKYADAPALMYATNNMPKTFELWNKLLVDNSAELQEALKVGRVLENYQEAQVKAIAEKTAQKITVGGIEGWLVNCNSPFVSDVGSYLSQKSGTFTILWQENANGLISCSLRSANNFSSVELNKVLFGGGGHPQASGAKVESYEKFMSKLKEFENKVIPGFGREEDIKIRNRLKI